MVDSFLESVEKSYKKSYKSCSSIIELFVCNPQDMIHIADTKVERRYGEFFIRQIHKCEEVSIYKYMI